MRPPVLLLLALLAAMSQAAEVHLRERVQLAATKATLGDVAEINAPPADAERLRHLTVRELSGAGPQEVLAGDVRAMLAGILPGVTVTGRCRIERAVRLVSEADLAAAAAVRARRDGEAEVATVRTSGAIALPDDGTAPTLEAEPIDGSPSGDIPFRVRVLQGGVEVNRALVVLRISRFHELPVAASAIPRGAVIGVHDVVLRRMEVTKDQREACATAEEAIGKIALTDLAEGAVLPRSRLQTPLAVRGGQPVQLVWRNGAVELTIMGESLSDGRAGEGVTVRRPDGQTVRGTVLDAGRVLVLR